MKTEVQVVYDNLKSVRRLLNMPFEKSMNKYKEFANVNISFVEINRIDDALRLLKEKEPKKALTIREINIAPFLREKRGVCPTCNKILTDSEHNTFCGDCGQAVKWE